MISVIIPHWPLPGTEEALEKCLESIHGQYDEINVVVNFGEGFAKACNKGLRSASGDYLFVINNDTQLIDGELKDMAFEDAVTFPKIQGKDNRFPDCFICIPRWIYEKVGGYDERFEGGYFEDDDLIRRWNCAAIPFRRIDHVVINHLHGGGLTMKQIGESKYMKINKEKYQQKWANI